MNRTPVKSSNIKSAGYSAADQQLEVEFSNGSVYRYDGVPPQVHADLMASESIGRAFGQLVRNKFEGKRLAAEPQDAP